MDGKKYYKKLEAFNLFLYRTFRIQYEHTHTWTCIIESHTNTVTHITDTYIY